MGSYPNYIPMNAPEVRSVVESFDAYEYDRVYGGWWGGEHRQWSEGGHPKIRRSLRRANLGLDEGRDSPQARFHREISLAIFRTTPLTSTVVSTRM